MSETCRLSVNHPRVALEATSLSCLLDGLSKQINKPNHLHATDGSATAASSGGGANASVDAGEGVAEVVDGMQQVRYSTSEVITF